MSACRQCRLDPQPGSASIRIATASVGRPSGLDQQPLLLVGRLQPHCREHSLFSQFRIRSVLLGQMQQSCHGGSDKGADAGQPLVASTNARQSKGCIQGLHPQMQDEQEVAFAVAQALGCRQYPLPNDVFNFYYIRGIGSYLFTSLNVELGRLRFFFKTSMPHS